MSSVIVWYLLVQRSYDGGMVAVPQVSREQCADNVKFLRPRSPNWALLVCVPGAPPK